MENAVVLLYPLLVWWPSKLLFTVCCGKVEEPQDIVGSAGQARVNLIRLTADKQLLAHHHIVSRVLCLLSASSGSIQMILRIFTSVKVTAMSST